MKFFLSYMLLGAIAVNGEVQLNPGQLPDLSKLGPLLEKMGPMLNNMGPMINNMMERLIQKRTSVKVVDMKPTIPGDNIKRKRYFYGPFRVHGKVDKSSSGNFFSLDPQGTSFTFLAADFPKNITIVQGTMSIDLMNGETISNKAGVYTHHAAFMDMTKPLFKSDMACSGMPQAVVPSINILAGSAADSASAQIPQESRAVLGNWIGPNEKIMILGDLVNYNNESKEVYMVADLQYIEGQARDLLEPHIHILSINQCEALKKGPLGMLEALNMKAPVGKKQWSIKSGDMVVTSDSKLLGMRGHMHDGGVNFVFRLNGRDICNSKAEYNAGTVGVAGGMPDMEGGHHGRYVNDGPMGGGMTGMLGDVNSCFTDIDVKKGDKIEMEAYYDLDLHPSRERPDGTEAEAMALAILQFGAPIGFKPA